MKTRTTFLAALTAVLLVPSPGRSHFRPRSQSKSGCRPSVSSVWQKLQGPDREGRFPGAVAMIIRKGRIGYFETFGQRDPATGAPMSKDAIFRLYSMTKPFASVAAMMLVEDGKLTLADPVSKYLPQLASLQVAVPKQDAEGKTTYTLVPASARSPSRICSGTHRAFVLREQHAEPTREGGIHWRSASTGTA